MKKLILFILSFVMVSVLFEACDDMESYADKLKKESRAIQNLIRDSNITVITQQQFLRQDCTTNLDRNEFVQTPSGVYMQVIDKGSDNPADTVQNNDILLVRFTEWRLHQDSVAPIRVLSNLALPYVVDEFRYIKTPSTVSGIFKSGLMYSNYSNEVVPAGWLVPLDYVRDGASVKLIVPSKMGHTTAQGYTYAYYYYIKKYQIYR